MTISILLALLAQAAAPAPAATPPAPDAAAIAAIPATNLREIDRCDPPNIFLATRCIENALGPKTADAVYKDAGLPYRDAFAALLTEKWNLADPNSRLARELRQYRVYDARDAAYVIIADMDARRQRSKLDYGRLARDRAADPNKLLSPTFTVTRTVVPPKEKPGPLPLDRCKRPGDAADVKIVTCELRPDYTIARTTSGAPGGALPAGAVPVPLDKCNFGAALPAGTRLKGCFKLPDGRILKQTVRTVEAPQN